MGACCSQSNCWTCRAGRAALFPGRLAGTPGRGVSGEMGACCSQSHCRTLQGRESCTFSRPSCRHAWQGGVWGDGGLLQSVPLPDPAGQGELHFFMAVLQARQAGGCLGRWGAAAVSPTAGPCRLEVGYRESAWLQVEGGGCRPGSSPVLPLLYLHAGQGTFHGLAHASLKEGLGIVVGAGN